MLHRPFLLFCIFGLCVRLALVLCHCAIRLVLHLRHLFVLQVHAGYFLMSAGLLGQLVVFAA